MSSRPGTLLINGVQTEAPITQSLACATEVRKRVESNGLQHATQPVLVFPGWFVDPMPTPWPPVWIMNPIGLQRFVQRTCRADPGARPSAALVSIFDAWAREPDPESLA